MNTLNNVLTQGLGEDFFPTGGLGGIGFSIADVVQEKTILDIDNDILTAIVISIYSDLRFKFKIGSPPIEEDRRGWWGERLSDIEDDKFGSSLWNYESSQLTDSIVSEYGAAARNSLKWMLSDLVASSIIVNATREGSDSIRMTVDVYKNKDSLPGKYYVVWDTFVGGIVDVGLDLPEQSQFLELSSSSDGQLFINNIEASILEFEDGIQSAILISLFTDRRRDEPTQDGDYRGYWGDSISPLAGNIGSLLWILQTKAMAETAILEAENSLKKSLAWMVEDRIVDSVNAIIEREGTGNLSIVITVKKPGEEMPKKYSIVWTTALEGI